MQNGASKGEVGTLIGTYIESHGIVSVLAAAGCTCSDNVLRNLLSLFSNWMSSTWLHSQASFHKASQEPLQINIPSI